MSTKKYQRVLDTDGTKYYCPSCGALYLEERQNCTYCEDDVTALPEDIPENYFGVDYMKIGLLRVLRIYFYQIPLPFYPFAVVFLLIKYLLTFLFRLLWQKIYLQGEIPLWLPQERDEKLWNSAHFQKSEHALRNAGFEFECVQKEVASYPEYTAYIFRHKSGQAYAKLMVKSGKRHPLYTRFIVFSKDNTCTMGDNFPDIPLPENVIKAYRFSGESTEELWRTFQELVNGLRGAKLFSDVVDFNKTLQLYTHRKTLLDVDRGHLSKWPQLYYTIS